MKPGVESLLQFIWLTFNFFHSKPGTPCIYLFQQKWGLMVESLKMEKYEKNIPAGNTYF